MKKDFKKTEIVPDEQSLSFSDEEMINIKKIAGRDLSNVKINPSDSGYEIILEMQIQKIIKEEYS